ncbi:MAG: OprO/OprP family phosphate-selective porin [Gammaproteobacteria bacterium]|nr:OprO/OprP family phosphate-selective porin [Gammaproteobacteria bacterium]
MYSRIVISAVLLAFGLSGPASAADSTEMLKKEVSALKRQNKLILDRLEAVMDVAEKSPSRKGASHTRLGGYGELHLNQLDNNRVGGSDKNEIDLHRLIVFLGHDFSKDIRFWSEIEIEHTKVDDEGGEVAIEQAYIEFDLAENLLARAGVVLVPVGIMNETHEPPTFYGVERNNVEKNIIPTTWREAGVSINGRSGALAYDVMLHSGLETSAADNYAIRDGRQSVRKAPADDFALTARVKWTGIAGLELSAAIQQQADITQGNDATAGSATLLETHLAWQTGPFTLRALYASWSLDGEGPAAVGADEQTGWYVEPSYKISPKFGVFARLSNWDNTVNSGADSETSQTDVGFNYWPHGDVVIKFDYQTQDAPEGSDEYDGINLGIGYQF